MTRRIGGLSLVVWIVLIVLAVLVIAGGSGALGDILGR